MLVGNTVRPLSICLAMRGALIAIEGLDRTGKTTQTNFLTGKLEKHNIRHELIKFPERTTTIGKIINTYLSDKSFQLNDQAIHLLFSANRWELIDTIKNYLEQGITVILDRYVYSGCAYSTAKGLSFDWCMNTDKGLPKPDATIFLKFEDGSNTNRSGFGDERYELVEFQEKVKIAFENFDEYTEWKPIFVDGLSKDEVHEKIWSNIEELLSGVDSELLKF